MRRTGGSGRVKTKEEEGHWSGGDATMFGRWKREEKLREKGGSACASENT